VRSGFPRAAQQPLADAQLRRNLRKATHTIRDKRARVVSEVADWEALRDAGRAIKDDALRHLGSHLQTLEASVARQGGVVHWARDATEANSIVARLVRDAGASEVVKVKSMATDEIGLNAALEREGIVAHETDLAELIVQLAHDRPSHILVPAIHRNRAEIRDLFKRTLPGTDELSDDPAALAEAARLYLRSRFLSTRVGVSGANFAVAETGSVCVVESEGNGRMCTTLPGTLITVMGIEKVVPRVEDLGVMLQLLPRSSTGERMNPYTSIWTGVAEGDGPQSFHLILLDNGRTDVLADAVGRQALRCIRCSACLNVCPVYERTGGHAYESTYPGPIGAILTPQLHGLRASTSLPWASSLCGACADVCPVKIDIPGVLVHLRGRITDEVGAPTAERLAMGGLARVFASRRRYEAAQRAARLGAGPLRASSWIGPLGGWTMSRELPVPPAKTFREWWRARG
jgi:L-lactate dehydrogenase complex protein LldF